MSVIVSIVAVAFGASSVVGSVQYGVYCLDCLMHHTPQLESTSNIDGQHIQMFIRRYAHTHTTIPNYPDHSVHNKCIHKIVAP